LFNAGGGEGDSDGGDGEVDVDSVGEAVSWLAVDDVAALLSRIIVLLRRRVLLCCAEEDGVRDVPDGVAARLMEDAASSAPCDSSFASAEWSFVICFLSCCMSRAAVARFFMMMVAVPGPISI